MQIHLKMNQSKQTETWISLIYKIHPNPAGCQKNEDFPKIIQLRRKLQSRLVRREIMRTLAFAFCLLLTLLAFAQDSEDTASPQAEAEATPEASQPAEEPSTMPAIVVTARFDYCDPVIMQRRLPSDEALLTNFVNPPGFQIDKEPTRNPNFFDAGWKTANITDIDYTNQKLKVSASYMSCQTAKCDAIVSSNSSLTLERELRYGWDDESISRHYTVSGEVEFSQMYDANYEDVQVPCPISTCRGIVFYGPRNRNYYTATRVGDHIERKLVVNGAFNSRFVDSTTGSTLQHCPPVEPPEPPKSRNGRRR